MKLSDKGNLLPPPILDKYSQMVSDEIQKWKSIIAATHWSLFDNTKVDGADFYVGEVELGHIHLDGSVHLATDKELKEFLLDKKLAKQFPYGENWVQFKITTEKDANKAILLFRVNYERINGISLQELIPKFNNSIQ